MLPTLLIIIFIQWVGAGVVHDYNQRLCATSVGTQNIFGFDVRTEMCTHYGNGTATHNLSETPHWCLHDYLEVTKGSTTVKIPSGCSLWVKDPNHTGEVFVGDRTGLIKLSRESRRQINESGGVSIEGKTCHPFLGAGLNPGGSHNLGGTEHWCRQETISLPFARVEPVPSGCSCYVETQGR